MRRLGGPGGGEAALAPTAGARPPGEVPPLSSAECGGVRGRVIGERQGGGGRGD